MNKLQGTESVTVQLTLHEQRLIALALEQFIESEPLYIPDMSVQGKQIVEKTQREMKELYNKFKEW